jgi:membrane protease YdiL (CAAX protease family)
LINPIFEELIVVGYLIPVLEKMKNLTFAINVSVMIRLLYHLYQGPVGVVSIVPMGLLFAYWYAYKRNLWPLLIAHFIEDLLGLVYFT